MTTFNIANTMPTGTFHKRQSGLWGQVRASAEIEAKLARVEPLFKELHGRNMSRRDFFNKCRELARGAKGDVGGYLQYMSQDMAGILLRQMHTAIGKQVRRNRKLKNNILKRSSVTFELDAITINTADFVKRVGPKATADGFALGKTDTLIRKLHEALTKRKYAVTKETLMKEVGIPSVSAFNTALVNLRRKGFEVETLRGSHKSVASKYSLSA